jgi:pimeloyl-ACP methyl ester carboxylesterase
MSRVLVVPGLAVQGYADLAVGALRAAGLDAELLDPPAWRTVPADLELYGRQLGRRLHEDNRPVAVLIGLSVGTQAAAVAAAVAGRHVQALLLVSPAATSSMTC